MDGPARVGALQLVGAGDRRRGIGEPGQGAGVRMGMETQMSNRARPKLCMFCGKDESFGPMNREHFAFRGLWAGPRPDKTRTLPAHVSCNAEFAEDNEYFRDVLAMEASPKQHPEVERLQHGKLKRKLRKQPGSVSKTLKNLRLVPQFTPSGLYVGFAPAFEVDWPRMERVLQNVVKGIYYTAVGEPLPQECIIGVIALNSRAIVEKCRPAIDQMVGWQSFGDDVFMCRYVTGRSVPRIACLMQFYRRRFFFGQAMTKRLIEEIESRQKQRPSDEPP